MLLSVNENLSETGSSSTATSGNSPGTSAATIVPEIRDTLERAKSMMGDGHQFECWLVQTS